MKLNKKMAAMLVGLTMGISGTALAAAADGADSFSDVPKDHWSYQALDFLAKDGVVEGYADGTFQGNRAMTRYEMASIVAKAMQKQGGSVADQAVLEKLEKEYGSELGTLKKQVDENTKQIAANKSALERVNLHGFVRTQWDSDNNVKSDNEKDRSRFYMNLYGDFKVSDHWTARFQSETNRHYAGNTQTTSTHKGNDSSDQGTIQRIWVDGTYGKGGWVSIGRTWRGLGNQNMLQGGETDGVQFGYPINKNGLQASGFYMAPSWDGADFSMYGVAMFGPVGHNFDINVAYAKVNKDKWFGNYGYVLSAGTNLAKNVRLIGDYVRTGASDNNTDKAVRLNYKGTDLNSPGSFGLYTRYVNYGANGDIGHDDEWGSLKLDSRGWIFGVKYVPWKNVEWETMYESAITNASDAATRYTRHLFRTQMDFHF